MFLWSTLECTEIFYLVTVVIFGKKFNKNLLFVGKLLLHSTNVYLVFLCSNLSPSDCWGSQDVGNSK